MADINNVTLVGRLTRDAELKYTPSGVAVCKLGLALNSTRKQGDEWINEPNFFDITVFGRQGEALNSYLIKGKQIAVAGQLRQDRWEQEGQTRSRVYVLADNIMLLGGAREEGSAGRSESAPARQPEGRNAPPARNSTRPAAARVAAPSSPMPDFDDDIPF